MAHRRNGFHSAFFLMVLAGFAAVWVGAGAGQAYGQSTPKKRTPQSQWRYVCSQAAKGQPQQCQIIQRLLVRKSRKTLLSVSLRRTEARKITAMLLHLPHGMHLPAGVVIRVDKGKPIKVAIQTCDLRGCFAGVPVDAVMLKAKKRGQTLSVAFRNLKKQTIAINLNLKGFTAAFKKL